MILDGYKPGVTSMGISLRQTSSHPNYPQGNSSTDKRRRDPDVRDVHCQASRVLLGMAPASKQMDDALLLKSSH